MPDIMECPAIRGIRRLPMKKLHINRETLRLLSSRDAVKAGSGASGLTANTCDTLDIHGCLVRDSVATFPPKCYDIITETC